MRAAVIAYTTISARNACAQTVVSIRYTQLAGRRFDALPKFLVECPRGHPLSISHLPRRLRRKESALCGSIRKKYRCWRCGCIR